MGNISIMVWQFKSVQALIASTSNCQEISSDVCCRLSCRSELTRSFGVMKLVSDTLSAHISDRTARLGSQILLKDQVLCRIGLAALVIFIQFNSLPLLAIFTF